MQRLTDENRSNHFKYTAVFYRDCLSEIKERAEEGHNFAVIDIPIRTEVLIDLLKIQKKLKSKGFKVTPSLCGTSYLLVDWGKND